MAAVLNTGWGAVEEVAGDVDSLECCCGLHIVLHFEQYRPLPFSQHRPLVMVFDSTVPTNGESPSGHRSLWQ